MWLTRVSWSRCALVSLGSAGLFLGALACSPKTKTADDNASPTASNELRASTAGQGLVISQVYGGPGQAAAKYNRDFVELFNRGKDPVSLKGVQLHYAGPIGTFSLVATLPADAVVPPGGYYLVGFAAGAARGAQDVRVDAVGNMQVNVLPTNGKVALVRDVPPDPNDVADAAIQALGCGQSDAGCGAGNPRIIDVVGYGVASDFEGTGPASPPGTVNAVWRKNGGCADSNDNPADFEVAAPKPRNAKSPVNLCDQPSTGARP